MEGLRSTNVYKRYCAARLIQARIRGYLARKHFVRSTSAVTIQRRWKGILARRFVRTHREKILQERDRVRRERRANQIQKIARQHLKRKWWRALTSRYCEAKDPEVFHQDQPLPEAVWPALQVGLPIIRKMRTMHWAKLLVGSLSPEERALMRQKITALSIFRYQKTWGPSRRFEADYLDRAENPHRAAYQQMLSDLFKAGGDTRILFSDICVKVNRKGKSQDKIVLVTDNHIYKFKVSNHKQAKEGVELDKVGSISMSSGPDTFVVIHMKEPARDMVLNMGLWNCERYSELVTVLVEVAWEQHRDCPVLFKNIIHYNNSRKPGKKGDTVELKFVPNPTKQPGSVFHRDSNTAATILYGAGEGRKRGASRWDAAAE